MPPSVPVAFGVIFTVFTPPKNTSISESTKKGTKGIAFKSYNYVFFVTDKNKFHLEILHYLDNFI